jgi:branched-chain amino acid transport system substrate-binding protein
MPDFEALEAEGQIARRPIVEALKTNKANVFLARGRKTKRGENMIREAATKVLISITASAFLAFNTAGATDKKYSTGVSDTEIKIGHTTAYSGPASAFAIGGRTLTAFFKMINESGGINGRRVEIISLDDGYSPPKAVEQTRKLVESDEVFAIYGVSGTPTNAATRTYLNKVGVPQILIATGATKFNDPKNFPWTMPFWPTYTMEQKIYVEHILKTKPNAKIAVLYANDDFGKDNLNGIKAALGANSTAKIVAEEPYELSSPSVAPQVVNLKATGADVFINASTPKFAAQAIRTAHEIGWTPVQYLSNAVASIEATFKPAGLDASVGVITGAFLKLPSDARWKDDKDVKAYLDFMRKSLPNDDANDFYAAVTYANANMLLHILKACGDELTRENLMKQVSKINDVHVPLHLPKVVLRTAPDDLSAFKALQLQRFDGQKWVDVE